MKALIFEYVVLNAETGEQLASEFREEYQALEWITQQGWDDKDESWVGGITYEIKKLITPIAPWKRY